MVKNVVLCLMDTSAQYVGQKGLAIVLTITQLVGVTPEVNLRNPLQMSPEIKDRGITKKDLCPPIFFKRDRGISNPTKRSSAR